MITAEIAGVLLLLMGLLVYAMVRTVKKDVIPERRGGARILIVDDDPDAVKIARRILETHGYEVSNASGGAEGLRVMRSTKPDLVLLDIMMDYITDGLDVSNAMRRDDDLRNIPVVMVTSLTGEGKWLNKPVRAEKLLRTVQGCLGASS